ncbi:MAG TPA: xanthine dehydrogenase family protein subunit M [Chloroflexota bacterium]
MIPFELHTPGTLPDALQLLNQYGDEARPMSGGTALVLLMQQRLVRPGHVISLTGIPELNQMKTSNGTLEIGGTVQHRRVETDADVKQRWPLLAEAYRRVATVRIRNVATVGGGLAHADPSMDPPAALIVLNARVRVAGTSGTREIPIEELWRDYYETSLAPGELITQLLVPAPAANLKSAYIKFLPRTADDYPTIAVAAGVVVENGRCSDVRIALNAAGPTAIRARAAEDILRGQEPTPELLRAAAATVPAITDPTSDHRGSAQYKRRMAEVFVRRTLEQALAS